MALYVTKASSMQYRRRYNANWTALVQRHQEEVEEIRHANKANKRTVALEEEKENDKPLKTERTLFEMDNQNQNAILALFESD